MFKKGQITVFIIIGIVILFVVGSFLYLSKENTLESPLVNQNIVEMPNGETVGFFVQNCLERVSEDGVLKIGRQGGYYKAPLDYSLIFFDDLIPYYYADDKTLLQSAENSEKELESYLLDNLPACINNFEAFAEQKYVIQTGEMEVKVKYGNQVTIKLTYPLSIQQGILVKELNYFSHNVDVNFPKLFSTSEKLVKSNLEKPGYVCITCLENLAAMDNIKIDSYPVYDSTEYANDYLWFRLEEKSATEVNGQNFSFEFVTEYIIPEEDLPLQIESVDTLEAKVGIPFSYQIKTNQQNILFKDNVDLFEINESGKIGFIPTTEQRGSYFVTITAENKLNQSDKELFLLRVS